MDSVVHFEIPVNEIERAEDFYSRAFGWTMRRMEEIEYTAINTTPLDESIPARLGSINGGLAKRSDVLRHPVVTIRVDDIEAALAKIERLGGKIVSPKAPVADAGYSAYFMDTEGNVGGLWQDAVAVV